MHRRTSCGTCPGSVVVRHSGEQQRGPVFFSRRTLRQLTLTIALVLTSANATAQLPRTVVHADYQSVEDALISAVLGAGMSLIGVIDIGAIFDTAGHGTITHAHRIEFCSAELSHRLVLADPRNLVDCPFTFTIYELSDHPGEVRIHIAAPVMVNADALSAQIESRLRDILANGTAWWPNQPLP